MQRSYQTSFQGTIAKVFFIAENPCNTPFERLSGAMSFCIVTEYCGGGTLKDKINVLRCRGKGGMLEQKAIRIIYDISKVARFVCSQKYHQERSERF